jgi:predicted RNase H-like nuclease (RuvC/YqgF family)
MNETLARAKAHETRIRELEEEVQANDRVETLEKSLKGTQDRAESLEFQLSKSKQVSALVLSLFFSLLSLFTPVSHMRLTIHQGTSKIKG